MKGRIARLEGSTRKSDASNKSLKKYVNMLEKALKERDDVVKQLKAGKEVNLADSIRVGKEKESLAVKKERRTFCQDPSVWILTSCRTAPPREATQLILGH